MIDSAEITEVSKRYREEWLGHAVPFWLSIAWTPSVEDISTAWIAMARTAGGPTMLQALVRRGAAGQRSIHLDGLELRLK